MDKTAFSAGNGRVWPYAALGALTLGVLLFLAGANAVGVAPDRGGQAFAANAQHIVRHDDAVQAFVEQRYATAYGRFMALADEGHTPSAVMALAMVSNGATLFGSQWSATPWQLQRWSALAVNEVREHGPLVTEHDSGD